MVILHVMDLKVSRDAIWLLAFHVFFEILLLTFEDSFKYHAGVQLCRGSVVVVYPLSPSMYKSYYVLLFKFEINTFNKTQFFIYSVKNSLLYVNT